jgi:hypothetical protein
VRARHITVPIKPRARFPYLLLLRYDAGSFGDKMGQGGTLLSKEAEHANAIRCAPGDAIYFSFATFLASLLPAEYVMVVHVAGDLSYRFVTSR